MITILVVLQLHLAVAVSGPDTSPEYLPLRVASAEGYFAQEGLQVSLRTSRAEPDAAEALAQGRADLAATSLDAALRFGAVDGRPPRLLFGLTAAPPVALLVAAAHRGVIQSFEDLVGRRVGVPSPGAPEHRLLLAVLERRRISPARLTLLSLGQRSVVGALEAGSLDAAVLPDPWASRLVEEEGATILADFRRRGEAARLLGGATVHAGVFVRPDTRLAPAELIAVAQALLQATHRVMSAEPEALLPRLSSRAVGLKEDFVARVRGAREVYIPDGWVTAEMLKVSLALVRARAPLPETLRLPRRRQDLLLQEPLRTLRDSTGRPTP